MPDDPGRLLAVDQVDDKKVFRAERSRPLGTDPFEITQELRVLDLAM
jgi:hypothetical protein